MTNDSMPERAVGVHICFWRLWGRNIASGVLEVQVILPDMISLHEIHTWVTVVVYMLVKLELLIWACRTMRLATSIGDEYL